MTALSNDLIAVLNERAISFVTELMPDGSPQISQTWAATDGEHVLINTVETHQKTRNFRRDPRVAMGVPDPAAPARHWALRGSVVVITTDGAREHIDELSHKYLGNPYPGFGGSREQRARQGRQAAHTLTGPHHRRDALDAELGTGHGQGSRHSPAAARSGPGRRRPAPRAASPTGRPPQPPS